ncbi:hypothetical protein ACI2KT_08430 [Ensifer adhaerens]|jgi:hypothetical protein|uniref:hypothetical protein n=1 Tax=Ensifer TaxID=106591 RepID=UPI000A6DFAAA|nr:MULTISPECIES: hypothetical protein [Ensifer]HJS62973.1 hypothetical protein [Pseudolabrys sp.]MBD9556472.1 hypothetical protein [Ensifer sp. ENS03]MBD9568491.1 hypothetical protein [Ensifer sp. ENS08]MBD9623496.1 hypothetical protein [Ensifer sp. ENS06]RAS16535.1 hypothetical protein DEU52_102469 [Ensifer adhaerens]
MRYVETLKRLFRVKPEIRHRGLVLTVAKPASQKACERPQERHDSSGILKRSRDTQERHRLL